MNLVLTALATATTASAVASAVLTATLVRAHRGTNSDRHQLGALIDAAHTQSQAMVALSAMSAESIRLATGSFVFELRDRFDVALSATNVGVAGARWSAGPGFEAVEVEHVVFHSADRALIEVTLALSQAGERRVLNAGWGAVPAGAHRGAVRFTGQGGAPRAPGPASEYAAFDAAPDVPVFIDLVLEVDLFSALGFSAPGRASAPARLVQEAHAELTVTDLRPEGVVASRRVTVTFAATAAAAEDGISIDGLSVHAEISPERRTYLLVKDEHLELAFPTLSHSTAANTR